MAKLLLGFVEQVPLDLVESRCSKMGLLVEKYGNIPLKWMKNMENPIKMDDLYGKSH